MVGNFVIKNGNFLQGLEGFLHLYQYQYQYQYQSVTYPPPSPHHWNCSKESLKIGKDNFTYSASLPAYTTFTYPASAFALNFRVTSGPARRQSPHHDCPSEARGDAYTMRKVGFACDSRKVAIAAVVSVEAWRAIVVKLLRSWREKLKAKFGGFLMAKIATVLQLLFPRLCNNHNDNSRRCFDSLLQLLITA